MRSFISSIFMYAIAVRIDENARASGSFSNRARKRFMNPLSFSSRRYLAFAASRSAAANTTHVIIAAASWPKFGRLRVAGRTAGGWRAARDEGAWRRDAAN